MLRNTNYNELITILLTTGLTLISLAKLVAPKRFNELIIILGNVKYLNIYSREKKLCNGFDFLLFLNLIISLSVFIAISAENYTNASIINTAFILKLIAGIGLFIIIKTIVEYFISVVIDNYTLHKNYLFQKISYKNYMGILLLPINALLVYGLSGSLKTSYITAITLLIINLIGIITSYKTHQDVIKQNLFYFILYLCALEIAPYIILCKVFIT